MRGLGRGGRGGLRVRRLLELVLSFGPSVEKVLSRFSWFAEFLMPVCQDVALCPHSGTLQKGNILLASL